MKKENFERYAKLKAEEKRIKAEITELSPLLKEDIHAAGGDKVASDFGTFTLKPVKVWKYSEAVELAEKAVDELKEKEKATGIATSDVREDLVFTAPKAAKED